MKLRSIPPLAVYVVMGAVVGIESLGIPLPGEIVLIGAAWPQPALAERHVSVIFAGEGHASVTLGAAPLGRDQLDTG